ncbi:small, acid-soluble spore protein, H family [Anaerobacillus arseniciselenatis]|uniref:Small, acid-soluble spore protein H n=1 Tax=Anaerobacillus arseniciselenatis TaxID=85682 RepID=A0A1S2LTY0_9BACI|nr:H-type small acid-soluble spore protein [Anaerobacillus arseniciselenatis]OIJ15968.1 small, acid-soluble spore protein, H family [Anaerobacillus arseniciselenatis]
MNTNRAQQILESAKDIEVQHNGSSIWIQNVNPEEGTARVYPRQNPEQEMTVSVTELQEKH